MKALARLSSMLAMAIVAALPIASSQAASPKKKKQKPKKLSIQVVDPKTAATSSAAPKSSADNASAANATGSSPLPGAPVAAAAELDVPNALAGASLAERLAKSSVKAAPELPQGQFAALDLTMIQELVSAQKFREAEATLRAWMALRIDLHTGERLRLALLRAELLQRVGDFDKALEAIGSAKRYLRLSTESLTASADLRRVMDLQAQIELTELDIRTLERGAP